jgi:hypothetical protein
VVGFNIAGFEETLLAGKARRAVTPMINEFVPLEVHVTPAARAPKAMKRLASNRRCMGRHVAIMPMHFALDAGVLAAAIATCLLDAQARAPLVSEPGWPRMAYARDEASTRAAWPRRGVAVTSRVSARLRRAHARQRPQSGMPLLSPVPSTRLSRSR